VLQSSVLHSLLAVLRSSVLHSFTSVSHFSK
jgi:hypothetical protein